MTPASMPGIPVSSVILLVNSASLFVAVLAIGFSLVGAIAVWRAGKNGGQQFFRMFERLQVLQLLTVMLVIASATVLAMLGILSSNGVTGILSGVAGYVLGGLNRSSSPAAPPAITPANAGRHADALPTSQAAIPQVTDK